jgi:hypothetical protein
MTTEETRRIICALEDIGYRVSMDTEDSFTVVFPTRRVRKARVTVEPIDVEEEATDRAIEVIAKYFDNIVRPTYWYHNTTD